MSIPDIALSPSFAPRKKVGLVLDASGSMAGIKMTLLANAVKNFAKQLKDDPELAQRTDIAVFAFGGDDEVTLVTPWTEASVWEPVCLEPDGRTPLHLASHRLVDYIEEAEYRDQKQGQMNENGIFAVFSDGLATDGDNSAAERVLKRERDGSLIVLTVAIGKDADMEALSKFSQYAPVRIDEHDGFLPFFNSVTQTLSVSTQSVSVSDGIVRA